MTPLWEIVVLCPVFVLVAGAYASVGLGGGTGYLALMAMMGVSWEAMPSTALLLNLVVTGAAMLRFGLSGRLKWGMFLPFLLPAIPAAFLGGLLPSPSGLYQGVLAIVLAFAAAGMIFTVSGSKSASRKPGKAILWSVGSPAGGTIGFLSGFLGVGGGVFLGPVVHFLKWADHRETGAMNSAFILVLSAVGLFAHGLRGAIRIDLIIPFAISVLVGGVIGAHLAETMLSPKVFRYVFAGILLIASLKSGMGAAGIL